ncbi:phasin family protein [Methylorubrum populi]|uniref:phasin family protein n=1 Tax=Methylorubrum populi TaxID=223967 RepID=UPI0031F76AAF
MSTSRRRGRSPGAPARPQPPTVTTTQAGVADALLAETPVGKDQEESPQETSAEPVTGEAEAPAVEAAAEQPATDGPAADAVKDEEVAAETGASSETAPAETQAAETQAAADAALAEAPPEEPTETVAAAAEAVATETGDLIETQAEVLAEAAPPIPAAVTPSENAGPDAKSRTHSVRIGADFAFVPPFAPLTEINAKLFAFARGESEAALAHFQALVRAKSPAEAIRLQVTEMQRAADASLTCFSEIVRSANRLTDIARRH